MIDFPVTATDTVSVITTNLIYFNLFQILHMHVASVDKLPLTTAGSPLLIKCKTFLCVTFVIPKERDCHDVYLSLLQLSQPGEVKISILKMICWYFCYDDVDIMVSMVVDLEAS